jgi:hypothetical protein
MQRTRIRYSFGYWQKDADLAGIRDPDAVAKLPPDEREACMKLWEKVAALLTKVREKSQNNQLEDK